MAKIVIILQILSAPRLILVKNNPKSRILPLEQQKIEEK